MTGQMLKKLLDLATANAPLANKIDVKGAAGLWMAKFNNVPDDLIYTAFLMALDTCRGWPQVSDIQSAIRELQYEKRTEPNENLRLESRKNWTSKAAEAAFEAVKTDKVKQFVAGFDIADLWEFVRKRIPDISDESIRRNYNEIVDAKQSVEMCQCCMWDTAGCATSGFYRRIDRMGKNGWLEMDYAMCCKHPLSERREAV